MDETRTRSFRYLFGPVHSRRLGISLGVDLMPPKTCTLDCIYCECGKTTLKTRVRKAYVPTAEIMEELERFLSRAPALDHVTFSGAGEPTLHSGIGELIVFLKKKYPRYPVAILTNGTLLHDPRVRAEVAPADCVIASLDAATVDAFEKINRPHPDVALDEMLQGYVDFRRTFSHQFLIEVFVVPGINDTEAALSALKTALDPIRPDGVHLNTLDRPGTEPWVKAAGETVLRQAADRLGGADMARFSTEAPQQKQNPQISEIQLSGTLLRRPSTAEDIAAVFGIDLLDARRLLDRLVAAGKAEKRRMPRGVFYFGRKKAPAGKTG